uniref:Uncharacterized protein n=1 Tax=viral metagenome TaxID=1070528 RepID=A0A6C0KND3_9ZZZZ
MRCIILAGPLYDVCIPYIIEMIKSVPTIISTWEKESQEKISLLKEYAIDIITNKKIIQYNNIVDKTNFPIITITAGLNRAKELGYTHIMALRTDNYSPTIKDFFEIFANESDTKLVGLCWFNHLVNHSPYGYIMDHVIYGPIELQLKYRRIFQSENDPRHSEAFFQDNFFNKSPVSYDDVIEGFCFVIDKLHEKKQELFFTHKPEQIKEGNLIESYINTGRTRV